MSKLSNKIEARDRTIDEILNGKKYTVDYFQREYNWKQKHIEQLLTDLTTSFLNEYTPGNSQMKVEEYNNYFLGPFVISEKEGSKSIIDGQQRLTSITLILIYLNNLQKEWEINSTLEPLIFSEKFGKRSFNILVDERIACLDKLFREGEYTIQDEDDDSTINMAERYDNIASAFPEDDITRDNLPHFLDWLRNKVVLVEITAYSDDNAYTIFETMNDRGLNLTSTEMLKGFILYRFNQSPERQKADIYWKKSIQQLNQYDKDEDQRFFQAWLRSQYADTIRPGKVGSKNEDFEKIGTRFHNWVRDNLSKLKLRPDSPEDFEKFIYKNFRFYLSAYRKILDAERTLTPGLENIYYIKRWGIASSLSYPLLLAPLTLNDSDEMVIQKLNLVARYIEIFVVRRSINFRQFSSSSIRYTMCMLVKEIRSQNIEALHDILSSKIDEMEEKWNGFAVFRRHNRNKKFVRFLLSRITGFLAQEAKMGKNFQTYFDPPTGKPFEIEHIWANRFDEHADEFDQKTDFDEWRNRIGALVLLPHGTNQSYGSSPYHEKLKHYVKENLLASSLCELTYQSNPNFTSMIASTGLPLESHPEFKKADIVARQKLYQAICELIWEFPST